MAKTLVITFAALMATAASGAWLFFGFALFGPPRRRSAGGLASLPRRGLPLSGVTLHVILATVTLALFTYAMLQAGAL